MQVNFTINIDDRLVKGFKAFFRKRSVKLIAFAVILLTFTLVYALDSDERIEFADGDIIYADQLNHNFSYLWSLGSGSTVPVGTVIAYMGTSLPSDDLWLWCDGSSIDTNDSTYDELRTLLGSNYTPDLRGRVIAGANNYGSTGNAGRLPSWADARKGTPTNEQYEVQLTCDNIPAHTHSYEQAQTGFKAQANETSGTAVADSTTTTVSGTGTSTDGTTSLPATPDAFSIVQPTYTIHFIIKARTATD